jgi:cell division protein FtsB
MFKKIKRFYIHSIPWYLKNKFTITFFLLFSWVLLFDTFDLITVVKMRYEINKKQNEMEHIQALIEADKQHYHELTSDPELLEKFAREQYLMKKEDEDIYIILASEEE